MKRKHVRSLGLLILVIAACFVTNRVTKWRITSSQWSSKGAWEFRSRQATLLEFVQTHQLADGEVLTGATVPDQLVDTGICRVKCEGRFVLFELTPTTLIPSLDAATSYYVYLADVKQGGVNELIDSLGRRGTTYHVQVLSANGWYYWVRG
jgi:hypothetical protein